MSQYKSLTLSFSLVALSLFFKYVSFLILYVIKMDLFVCLFLAGAPSIPVPP